MLRKTIFFLILLRLAIGWHFFFEGWNKLDSHWNKTETKRPFTSAGYFQEATGPLGPFIRAQVGDQDEQLLARLTVEPIPEGKDPKSIPAATRLPLPLAQEIDDYTKRFLDAFKLDEAETRRAEAKAAQTKEHVVLWLTYTMPDKEEDRDKQQGKMWRMVKKASPDGKTDEVPMTMNERIVEYRAKLAEVRELWRRKNPTLGRDVEKARLIKAKIDLATMRAELTADLDKELNRQLREGLNDILKDKLARVTLPAAPAGKDQADLLLPSVDDSETLPEPYDSVFDEYRALVIDTYKHLTPEQKKAADYRLNVAKEQTAEWLGKKETRSLPAKYTSMAAMIIMAAFAPAISLGSPLNGLTAAWPHTASLRNDALGQVAQMKTAVNSVLTDDQAKGIPPPAEPPHDTLWWMDRLTMYGLTIIGACLLLGLFARTNCVLAALFLATTFLLYPPFPWLPQPPNNEGTYLYVNKNVVEMLALLTLATTATGRWLGLDALLYRLFHRDEPEKKPARIKAVRAA
jgi:uncharacterized membrane protein YphA (DoxX/SURF4 family)